MAASQSVQGPQNKRAAELPPNRLPACGHAVVTPCSSFSGKVAIATGLVPNYHRGTRRKKPG
jgi:hypothetical protein